MLKIYKNSANSMFAIDVENYTRSPNALDEARFCVVKHNYNLEIFH